MRPLSLPFVAVAIVALCPLRAQPAPVDGPIERLKPGGFFWAPQIAPEGPVTVIVSLKAQKAYAYRNGWNVAAIVALLAGVLPNLPGFLHAAFPESFAGVPAFFKTLYTYAWFAGLGISAAVYAVLMRGKVTQTASAGASV